MICPKCDTVNKDNAKVCQNCGVRLSETSMRPGAKKTERRYLAVGTAISLVVVLFVVMILWSFSCMCSGCHNAGENAVNEEDGDWSGEVVLSDTDTSYSDVSMSDFLE